MIVVTIVGLLAAIAMPVFIKHRDQARLSAIYNNLRILEAAKDQWGVESHHITGASVDGVSVVSDYINGGRLRTVVQEQYVPNPLGTPAGAQLPDNVPLGPYAPGSLIILTNL